MSEQEKHFIEVLTFVVMRHTYAYQTLDGLTSTRFEQFEGEWNNLINNNEETRKRVYCFCGQIFGSGFIYI